MSRKTPLDVWLRPNMRALAMGMLPAGAIILLGVLLFGFSLPHGWPAWTGPLKQIGGAMAVIVGLAILAGLSRQMRRPRLAYTDGEVHFYVRRGEPLRVPVESVEGFLLGEGQVRWGVRRTLPTRQLIARISRDRADILADEPLHPALAHACDNYLALFGTWCEPLSVTLVERLNRTLAETKRVSRDATNPMGRDGISDSGKPLRAASIASNDPSGECHDA